MEPSQHQESYWARTAQAFFLRAPGVVACGIGLILTVTLWAYTSPAVWLQFCRADVLPVAERTLGFRFGDVRVPGEPGLQRGFLHVEPGGLLASAGVRTGDIPVDHHGGEASFCGALRFAADGDPFPIYVIHVTEWAEGRARRREIVVPAYRAR
jgi:hypothetical protein